MPVFYTPKIGGIKYKASMKHDRHVWMTLFSVVFLDLLGFGIVIPILPYYSQVFGASAIELGWLMMSYSAMQFLFAPVWGRLSDRHGRRPILLMSIAGVGLSLLVLAFAPSLTWLFIGRILAGVFGANISTAYSYISDITTPANRAKGMGLLGASFGLGFTVGPALGGYLSQWGYATPILFAAGLSLFNFLMALRYLSEPLTQERRTQSLSAQRFSPAVLKRVLLSPLTGPPIGLFFLLTLAMTCLEVVMALFVSVQYGYDAVHAGFLFALIGVVMILVQGVAVGPVMKRWGEHRVLELAAVTGTVGFFLFSVSHSIAAGIPGLCLLAISRGLIQPALSSLTSKGAGTTEEGLTMGVYQSSSSLGRVVGPLIAGVLYDLISHRAPFFFGTLVMAFVVMGARVWRVRSLKVIQNPSTQNPSQL